jgi:hypothetical protein
MKTLNILVFFLLSGTPALYAGAQEASVQNFTLNQETQSLHLESKTFETVYRTDLVNDTC